VRRCQPRRLHGVCNLMFEGRGLLLLPERDRGTKYVDQISQLIAPLT